MRNNKIISKSISILFIVQTKIKSKELFNYIRYIDDDNKSGVDTDGRNCYLK